MKKCSALSRRRVVATGLALAGVVATRSAAAQIGAREHDRGRPIQSSRSFKARDITIF